MALHHRCGETLGSGGVNHSSAAVWFQYWGFFFGLASATACTVFFLCVFLPLFIDGRKEERKEEEEVDEPGCISMRCEISHSMRLPGLRHGSVHVHASLMKCAHEFVFLCGTHRQGGIQCFVCQYCAGCFVFVRIEKVQNGFKLILF